MSMEQARNITTDFGGREFLAPPRTITDITAILDQQKPDESYRISLLDHLNQAAPLGASPTVLSAYFRNRATTLVALGRFDEAQTAASEGVRYAKEANQGISLALSTLASVHFWGYGTGIEDEWSESLKAARTERPPNTFMTMIGVRELGELAADRGDLATARQMVAEADRALPVSRGSTPDWIFARFVADNAETHYHAERAAGRYQDAESWIRKDIANWRVYLAHYTSESKSDENSATARRRFVTLQTYLTRTLVAQGRTVEAEAVAREALLYALTYGGRDSPGGWIAIENLAQVLFAQGRATDAERLFAVDVAIRERLGIPKSNARNWMANAIAMQLRWADALSVYSDDRQERVVGETYAIYPRIIALYKVDRWAEGLTLARSTSERRVVTHGENSPETALAKAFVGAGLALQGDRSAALTQYRIILPSLLGPNSARDLPDEFEAPSHEYRRFVLESYLDFLAGTRTGTLAAIEIADAFPVADALRIAVTDRAVSASVARASLRSPGLAELARREQNAQQEINARQTALASALSRPVEEQSASVLSSLRSEIDELKRARSALTEEIGKHFPEYANLVNPLPASVEQARAALIDGEALVALYSGDKQSYVWALRSDGPVAFAVIPFGRSQLSEMVTQLRRALDPHAQNVGEIPRFDVALAYKLYFAILHPVEAGWKGTKTLIVAPHGPLAQIPFSLLVTRPVPQPPDQATLFSGYQDVPFLLREAAVTQVPSVAALAILRGMPPANPARRAFVGFGDPWFSTQQAAQARAERAPQATVTTRSFQLRAAPTTEAMASATIASLPRLADTAEEVREVAMSLRADPAKDVFLGPAANEWQVRNMQLDDRRVVMFATHGLVPGDLDGLSQPALALSAPSVANVDGDGLLTMDKILGLKLDADWVVLSACNTAASDGAGAEAVSGLGRAFFYAGARALLVTNWPVETASARKLTTTLFQRQAVDPSLSRAEALRQSMLSLIDGPGAIDQGSGRVLYSYAHPIFWAPFSLVGDGR